MFHAHFKGTHYEMGLRWGAALAKHNHYILEHIPFPITQDRKDFAAACVPIYQAYFPEILDEINGLAQGQHRDPEILQAVLFSMYAMPPVCNCSCFAVSQGADILLGRNSDFLPELESLNLNVIYHFSDGAYDFTGNTTAFIELEDGVNTHGLAVGMTSVHPTDVKPGLNAGMLLRFFLERCKNTQEVLHAIQKLPISSAQTITVADAGGEIAVIECNAQQTEIIRPSSAQPFVCATNRFFSSNMAVFCIDNIDDWQAETRYHTLYQTLQHNQGRLDISAAQALLSGKTGFLCQYDRSTGKDTVWSVIYDLSSRTIYRAEGNPGRRKFLQDHRFLF